MCLNHLGTVLGVVVCLVCLNGTLCNVLEEGQLVVAKDSDKISLVTSVAENKTFVENDHQISKVENEDVTKENGINFIEESRKKKNKKQMGLMQRILPIMIIPFMVSTSVIPMMLVSLKFMILKSAFIGKIAILLMLLNMFRRRTNGEGGVFNHNLNADEVAMEHYGYHGNEEYGAYVNRRKKRSDST